MTETIEAMPQRKTPQELEAALEAMLFACGSPVEKTRILEILELDEEGLAEIVTRLKNKYDKYDHSSGIALVSIESSLQLCTKPAYAPQVKRALELRKTPPLSKSALEVLAIVAYNQPVTRSFVETVRGVDSSYIISSLTDKGLIRECGTLDAPGRPTLFCTTENFLRCFGIESITMLPRYDLADNGQVSFEFDREAGKEGEEREEEKAGEPNS